jgi:transposase
MRTSNVAPQAWLADILARVNDHNIRALDQLLPWNWKLSVQKLVA